MCGILGAWLAPGEKADQPSFEAALALLGHRGPNDSGLERAPAQGGGEVVFGHTRLSVIDLSAGGHQPMHSRCGRLSLIFNGEIYNYRELRETLRGLGHIFATDSDTEVLLACWLEWRAECLDRLIGMFAFVLHDRAAATLTCVRDAFGIKPFFYTREAGRFLFASELPALRTMKRERAELNWQRAYDYLVHGVYDNDTSSFLRDVVSLAPGHRVTLDLESGRLGEPFRWWSPSIAERSDISFDTAVEMVREQFLQNIRLHLRSDVPLGAALSGGVDSSAVVCAMRHVAPDHPIHTFSFIARNSPMSEEAWVDQINTQVGANGHKITLGGDDLAADLDDLIAVQGEPFGSTSIYAQYSVFRIAREAGITVTLDGQGADELLAGYNGYPGHRLRSLIERGELGEAWRFLNAWAQWPGRSRADGVKRLMAELTSGSLHHQLRQLNGMDSFPAWIRRGPLEERGVAARHPMQKAAFEARGRRVVAKLADSLTHNGLPALLRHGDRNSMRFSIESRVPFLTTDMADLLLSLPESYLISPKGETKHVFRAAMRGIVPDEILDRRDKVGFATPEKEWLLGMAPTVRQWLARDPGVPFIDQPEVLRQFDQMVAGQRPFSWQIWRWINFFRWHEKFIEAQ
ncbi:asparagine synthase (glutamine-hydrolyzing) [Sphingoaurantiacus capsulatus]|uniref:asparagine synthase (glutamine-hydrolyzing) n=1 Tax=Sphingoaurantiacus capsulatus TaxID=1771310 RepID=A0ABV7XAW0_9SPHN